MPALSALTRLLLVLGLFGGHGRDSSFTAARACPVDIGDAESQGYDGDMARRIASHHRDELCRCVFTPPRAGVETVLIEYVITSTGSVAHAHVADTTAEQMTAECMADVVATWSFPHGPCGVAIVQQRVNLAR